MPYVLEKSVIDEIETYFPAEHWEYVKSKLEATELWAENSAPPPRVHMAVIWKSKGDIDKFVNELRWAADDWRDILVETGLGNENWREVLSQKGVDCENWS